MKDRRTTSVGIEHDFIEFLAGAAGLCEVQLFDLALALLICGFLGARFDFDFVVGVAVVAVLAGLRGGGLVGSGVNYGDGFFAVRVALGVVAVIIIHLPFVVGCI